MSKSTTSWWKRLWHWLITEQKPAEPKLAPGRQALTHPPQRKKATTAPPKSKYATIVVRRHDTLFDLAQTYNLPVKAIIQLNRLNDTGEIYIGQRLIIPSTNVALAKERKQKPQAPSSPSPTTSPKTESTQPHDTSDSKQEQDKTSPSLYRKPAFDPRDKPVQSPLPLPDLKPTIQPEDLYKPLAEPKPEPKPAKKQTPPKIDTGPAQPTPRPKSPPPKIDKPKKPTLAPSKPQQPPPPPPLPPDEGLLPLPPEDSPEERRVKSRKDSQVRKNKSDLLTGHQSPSNAPPKAETSAPLTVRERSRGEGESPSPSPFPSTKEETKEGRVLENDIHPSPKIIQLPAPSAPKTKPIPEPKDVLDEAPSIDGESPLEKSLVEEMVVEEAFVEEAVDEENDKKTQQTEAQDTERPPSPTEDKQTFTYPPPRPLARWALNRPLPRPLAENAIRAVYIPHYALGLRANRAKITQLIQETKINAVVIDVKSDVGHLNYRSRLPLAASIEANRPSVDSLKETIERLQANKVYVIGRLALFKDNLVAKAYPEWAAHQEKNQHLWLDKDGTAWLDPYQLEIWEYLGQIVGEMKQFNFDELHLDCLQFPPLHNNNQAQFSQTLSPQARLNTITAFLSSLQGQLRGFSGKVSATVSAPVCWRADDALIGQNIERLSPYLDVISPNFSPWPRPKNQPIAGLPQDEESYAYHLVYQSCKNLQKRLNFQKQACQIRPWLQDGLLQDETVQVERQVALIQAQIQGAIDGGASGFMMRDTELYYIAEAYDL